MRKSLSFVVGYEEIGHSLGLNESDGKKIIAPITKVFETDMIAKSIESLLVNVSEVFVNCSLPSPHYELGDIELSLTVNANGEVSILSAAQIAGGAEASIKVTLKRKE